MARWFDEKYSGKNYISLDEHLKILRDNIELFLQLDIRESERTINNAETRLKEELHQLNRKYSPSRQVKSEQMLIHYAMLVNPESKKPIEYFEIYKKIIEKHRKDIRTD